MDRFFNLRAEKQEHIINAALTVFGRNGYKKASIADIANEAGIAKGMVMYYFGSKKNLYRFLVERYERILIDTLVAEADENVTDYFEKLKTATGAKMAMMKKHPAILAFIARLHYETDSEVSDILEGFKSRGVSDRDKILLVGTDVSKFKDDVDPKLLDEFFIWASVGFSNTFVTNSEMNMADIDSFINDFYALLDLMQRHFYQKHSQQPNT